MPLRWYTVVVDSRDVGAQARWWAAVLDWQIIIETAEEVIIVPKHAEMTPPGAEGWTRVPPGLVFVPVPEGKTVKNRLHVDLAPHITDDRDAEIQRLVGLGAAVVDVGQPSAANWTVLADPEGNEFCVLSAREY